WARRRYGLVMKWEKGEGKKGGSQNIRMHQKILFPFSLLVQPVRATTHSPHCTGTPPPVSFPPVCGLPLPISLP
ncbi:MAG: hypothetical protein AVDCRST_MAG56-8235, partial [uncultured Cytophagales bacterium]